MGGIGEGGREGGGEEFWSIFGSAVVALSNQDCCPLQDKIISTTDHWSIVTIILSIKEKYTFIKYITDAIKFFQVGIKTCIYQTKHFISSIGTVAISYILNAKKNSK